MPPVGRFVEGRSRAVHPHQHDRWGSRDIRAGREDKERGGTALDEAYPEVERWRATVEGASALPIPEGQRSVEVLSHGTMVVKYYAPREIGRASCRERV